MIITKIFLIIYNGFKFVKRAKQLRIRQQFSSRFDDDTDILMNERHIFKQGPAPPFKQVSIVSFAVRFGYAYP